MSDGTFIRYSSVWDASAVHTLLVDMDRAGWSLGHPTTGRSRFLRAGGPNIGTEVHATPEGIAELATLTDRDELQFLFWFADGDARYCRVRRVHESLYATEFELAGDSTKRQQMITIALDTMRRRPSEVSAFVVALTDWDLETNWDAVVQGAPEHIPVMASLLGVPASIDNTHPELRFFPRRDDIGIGELVAIGDLDLLDPLVPRHGSREPAGPIWPAVLPHLLALNRPDVDGHDRARAAEFATSYLFGDSDTDAGHERAHQLRRQWSRQLATRNDSGWAAYYLLRSLEALRPYHGARNLCLQLHARFRAEHGDDSPTTLADAGHLAADLREIGEYQLARELDEDTLTRRRRILGYDRPET